MGSSGGFGLLADRSREERAAAAVSVADSVVGEA